MKAILPVEDLAAFAERDLDGRVSKVGVYWYECSADRRSVAAMLAEASERICIVPLFPRRGFDNANAIAADLLDLLDAEHSHIASGLTQAEVRGQSIALILVSRTPLAEPLIGSPVAMPVWFPYCGGSIVSIDILDAATSAKGTLQSQREAIGRLQTLLYELQGLMLARIASARKQDHRITMRLFQLLLKGDESAEGFLNAAERKHREASPQGFRAQTLPAAQELLGRLVMRVGTKSPNELPAFGGAFQEALSLSEAELAQIREPLFAVGLRSTIRELEASVASRCARNVLLSLYFGAQLVTAAAHSAEYGEFEVVLLRSTLLDITNTLTSFKATIA